MSGGSHKIELCHVCSLAVDNEKAKISTEDEQMLREAEPFHSIDDVIMEFRSKGYVAPVKGDAFQQILMRLDKSNFVRGKQGQDVASEPDQLIISMDDIIDLRRLVDQHVGKSVRAEFDEKLNKMGSEDRLVRKQMNHIEDSNRGSDIADDSSQQPLQQNLHPSQVPISEVQVGGIVSQNFEPVVPNNESVEVPVHETDDNVVHGVDSKIDPVEEDEQHNDPEVDEDVIHRSHDDIQSMSSQPIEDPDELRDCSNSASHEIVVEKDSEEHETVESEDKESLEDKQGSPQSQKNSTHPHTLAPDLQSDKPKMSPEEIQRRFDQWSHAQLVLTIMNNSELSQPAFAVLKSRGRGLLSRFIVENHEVSFSVERVRQQVLLAEGREYGYQLVRLMYTMLKVYDCSGAFFDLKAIETRTALPFEQLFRLRSHKIQIRALRMNNPELAPLLRYVSIFDLCVAFPSSHLFDNDEKLMATNLKYLELASEEVDNVNKLMEKCSALHMKLAPNSYWSDSSVSTVFMKHAKSPETFRRTIVCHYFDHPDCSHKTISQWRKLLDNFRLVYWKSLSNSDRQSEDAVGMEMRITMEGSSDQVIFTMR